MQRAGNAFFAMLIGTNPPRRFKLSLRKPTPLAKGFISLATLDNIPGAHHNSERSVEKLSSTLTGPSVY